ncbi:MAG: hypothetical protein HGA97_10345 [Chlorobiaceae bacterium]|nr:hypothetical protein [Chlorobiaceae bacterium]
MNQKPSSPAFTAACHRRMKLPANQGSLPDTLPIFFESIFLIANTRFPLSSVSWLFRNYSVVARANESAERYPLLQAS